MLERRHPMECWVFPTPGFGWCWENPTSLIWLMLAKPNPWDDSVKYKAGSQLCLLMFLTVIGQLAMGVFHVTSTNGPCMTLSDPDNFPST